MSNVLQDRIEKIEQNIIEQLEQFPEEQLGMIGIKSALIPMMAGMIVEQMDLPKSIVLEDFLADQNLSSTVDMAASYVKKAQSLFGFLIYLWFAVFLVLCLLLRKTFPGIRWFGISTLISGGIFLIGIQLLKSPGRVEGIIGMQFDSLPVPKEFVLKVLDFTISRMQTAPIIVIIIGAVFFAAGLLLGRKKEH